MCVDIQTKQFKVISSVCILRCLNEFFNTGKFNGLCNIIANISYCEFENDKNIKQYGLLINENYNIDYNNTSKNTSQIKINDVIVNIDHNNILENGNIYDNEFKCLVPYSVFVALHYKTNDRMTINLLRETNKDDLDEKTINIYTRSVNSAKYIPKFNVLNTYIYDEINCDGIKFMTLSEDILDIYINNNIRLSNDILKHYEETPYRNSDQCIVFINDIDRNMAKKVLSKINDYNLPLKLINTQYTIPIVTKINKKPIVNMETLKSYIKLNKDYTIYVKYDNIVLKLIFKNGFIEDIKI